MKTTQLFATNSNVACTCQRPIEITKYIIWCVNIVETSSIALLLGSVAMFYGLVMTCIASEYFGRTKIENDVRLTTTFANKIFVGYYFTLISLRSSYSLAAELFPSM